MLGVSLILATSSAFSQYCAGGPSSTSDSNVQSVVLNGDATNINYNGCPGVSGSENQLALIADLTAGSSYTTDVQFGTCGGNYGGAGEAWIDFNGNEAFEASESIGTWSGTPPTTLSNFAFTVPANSVVGDVRMRVNQQESGSLPLNPCASYTWGSSVDFIVSLSGGTGCFSPSALTVSNILATTAEMSWAPIVGGTGYNVQWGVSGFTPGIGVETGSATGTTTTADIIGLTPEVCYDAYVQSNCSAGASTWVGPIAFCALPLCPTPQTVASTVGALDAQITWTAGGIETDWNVEYGPVGFPLGTGMTNNESGATSSGITGLTQLTCYNYYVQANCIAASATSLWVGPLEFCTVATCPEPSALSSNVLSPDSVEINWTTTGIETEWTVSYGVPGFVAGTGMSSVSSTNPDTLTGLMADTEYEYYVQANCGASDASVWVGPMTFTTEISCAEVTAINVTSLTVDSAYIMWNAGGTETAWNIEYGVDGFTLGSGTGSVESATNVELGNLTAGTDYDFYVQAICGAGDSAQWVGPFNFSTLISCAQPTFLDAINISNSSANLLFQAGGSEDQWNIEWGAPGFEVGTGEEIGSVSNTSDNPYYATNLSTGTTFEYYVQAACGAGDLSVWSGPYTFATLCGTFTAPYNESFDNVGTGTTPPNCWENPSIGEQWIIAESGSGGPDYGVDNAVDHTSGTGNYAWIDASGGGNGIGNNELISPEIDFSANTESRVGFWLLSNNTDDGAVNTIRTDVWNGSAWIELGTYSGNNPAWVDVAYLIPANIPTTTKFRLVQDDGSVGSDFNNDLLVDDFYVIDNPPCTPVTAGTATTTPNCSNGEVALFDLITGNDPDGTWFYPNALAPTVTSTTGNFVDLVEGTDYTFDYVVSNFCSTDTVSVTFNYTAQPNAGGDGAVTSCPNHTVVLIQELSGSVTFGGTWSDDDNAGGLVNGIIHPVNIVAGTYSYSYVVENGACTDTAMVVVTFDECLGVEANEVSSLEVYPNPVADVLTIANLDVNGNATISLLDLQGKVVYSKTISDVNGNYELDLSRFENGIYVVEVTSELDSQKVRVVKH